MWKREKKSKYSFWLQKEVKNQILHIFQTSDIIYIVILVFFFKFESVLKERTSKNIFLERFMRKHKKNGKIQF